MTRITAIVLGAALAAGCAGSPLPDEHYYRLDPALPAADAEHPRLDGLIQVQAPVGDGLLSERTMVFQPADAPNTIKQYRYHFWHMPPPAMLQRALADHLRAAGTAARVTTGSSAERPDWVVGGTLLRFEHVIGDRQRVRIELEIEVHSGTGEFLMVRRYDATEPTDGRGPGPAAAAFERALGRVLDELGPDLAGLGA